MIFFTADTHFDHANIIRLCNRPYESIEQMNEDMIGKWNRKVTNSDTVYILGDMFFRSKDPEAILGRLRGKKYLIIGNHDTLQPDVFGLVEAARILSGDGFEVFPYTTDDLVVAERLLEAGCRLLMPWCAPIGSARGPQNVDALRSLRGHFPEVPLIVDAGIGRPSHAAAVMELGYDAVLLNTAVARAGDPVAMASAFGKAIAAGREAFHAGPLEPRDMAVPSTPVIGMAAFS